MLVALNGASALKYGQPEGYPPVQWFGPNGVPGEVLPLGVPDNYHIPVAFRHRAGKVRGYGERPHGADDLYFLYLPALQPGQRRLTDADLLRELRFADGYMPSARYVVLISALGAGGVIDELRWVQTNVANVRRQIQGGLFLQHWYVADPWAYCGGYRDAHYVHDPMDDEDPDDGDYDPGPPARSECDFCGSCFWPDAGWGSTDDWKGTGMSCCGCQSDSCDPIEVGAPGDPGPSTPYGSPSYYGWTRRDSDDGGHPHSPGSNGSHTSRVAPRVRPSLRGDPLVRASFRRCPSGGDIHRRCGRQRHQAPLSFRTTPLLGRAAPRPPRVIAQASSDARRGI